MRSGPIMRSRAAGRRGAALVALLALLLVAVLPAEANMANPQQPGDASFEPNGVQTVAIRHEALTIDMRPLAEANPVLVDAVYTVANDGPAKPLDLEFVAVAHDGSAAAVTLDAQPVPSRAASLADLPPSWQPPRQTPALTASDPLPYAVRGNSGLTFGLTLPPGEHTIAVHYQARAAAYASAAPTRYWQLGYVLAPARDWASFGGLDVAVQLPPGWRAAASPALARQGDTLRGVFGQIPADALAITAQAPAPALVDPRPAIWLAGLALCLAAGALAGAWLARRGRRSLWAAPLALLAGGGLQAAVLAAAPSPLAHIPAAQISWIYSYLQRGAGDAPPLLAFVVAAIATLAAAQLGVRLARGR